MGALFKIITIAVFLTGLVACGGSDDFTDDNQTTPTEEVKSNGNGDVNGNGNGTGTDTDTDTDTGTSNGDVKEEDKSDNGEKKDTNEMKIQAPVEDTKEEGEKVMDDKMDKTNE